MQNVESLVGLTLSQDEESIEICHLLNKNDISLENVRKLIHALLSVISVDLKSFVQEKSCPGGWLIYLKARFFNYFYDDFMI